MDMKKILSAVDHTLLLQTATWDGIKKLCDEGIKYGAASVCIPPCYVKKAADYVGGKIKICTVIGFPNGYNTTETKCFEASDAVKNGADEIDMVINIGVAGTLCKELGVMGIAVADMVVQHDMNTSALGDPIGLLSGINEIYLPCDKKMMDTLKECLEEKERKCER